MKQKNIKVAYTSRSCGNSYTQVPKIQMEGKWLEELGFSIGSTIVVEYDDGSIRIRQMTEEELADRRKAELEKNLQLSPQPSEGSGETFTRIPGDFPVWLNLLLATVPHLKTCQIIPGLTPPSACR